MDNISVIITTYNSSRTILSAINSVFKQKNIKFEIIIIDDFSSDFNLLKEKVSTIHCCDIKIVQPLKKGNANISRNLGVNLSKYNYVAFLDADDTWNDEHLFQGVKCLQSNNADIVFSKVQFVKDKEIILSKQLQYRGDIADYIFSNGIAVTSSLIVKKISIEKCIFDEEQLKHQDWEFLIRAQNQGLNICQFDYIGLNYTLSTGSNMSSKFNPKATVRFLEKTLPIKYHNEMITSQLLSMLNIYDYRSVILLEDEVNEAFNSGYLSSYNNILISLSKVKINLVMMILKKITIITNSIIRKIKNA